MFTHPFGLRRYNPLREMTRLQKEMNRLFENTLPTNEAPSFPSVNIWANEDGAVVTAELPGMNPDNIDINVTGDQVTLNGSREERELPEGAQYHRRERGFGKFTRSFQLPFAVEADKVEAVFQKGILHISLPRAEAEKPRKIAVKVA